MWNMDIHQSISINTQSALFTREKTALLHTAAQLLQGLWSITEQCVQSTWYTEYLKRTPKFTYFKEFRLKQPFIINTMEEPV